jgi:hypothetical protein
MVSGALRASSHAERQEDEQEVLLAVLTYSFGLRGRTYVLAACEQSTGRKGSMCVLTWRSAKRLEVT